MSLDLRCLKELEGHQLTDNDSEVDDAKKPKHCFGPATTCQNCESRQETPREESSFKRCTACYVVAYCSEKCQKEHWFNSHQKMCKLLSNKKLLEKKPGMSCVSCSNMLEGAPLEGVTNEWIIKRANDPDCSAVSCSCEVIQRTLLEHYWHLFGFHCNSLCSCTQTDKLEITGEARYPMQCPFQMGEVSGKYVDWVDEKLGTLTLFINAIKEKFDAALKDNDIEIEVGKIRRYILVIRANYWYFVTNEKKRYMTQVIFVKRLLDIMEAEFSHGDCNMFLKVDTGIRKFSRDNVWWETFLHHMGDFYRRIRWNHYQLYNVSLPDNKKVPCFDTFEQIQRHAISCLKKPVEVLLPSEPTCGSSLTKRFLVPLPQGAQCFSCEKDFSSMSAVWILQSPLLMTIFKQDGNYITVLNEGYPVIFKEEICTGTKELDRRLISCGDDKKCLDLVSEAHIAYFDTLARLTINWIFRTQTCYGCLKFCYESHRCSRCRSVRYCSKECLLGDWKAHKEHCGEMAVEPDEAINIRKLEGVDKENFFANCDSYLCKVDPYFKFFSERWKAAGLGVDDIIRQSERKNKSHKREGNKKKKTKNREEVHANSVEVNDNEENKAVEIPKNQKEETSNKKSSFYDKEAITSESKGTKENKPDDKKIGNSSCSNSVHNVTITNAERVEDVEVEILKPLQEKEPHAAIVEIKNKKGPITDEEIKKNEEDLTDLLSRNGFDMDNITITSMRINLNSSKEERAEQLEKALTKFDDKREEKKRLQEYKKEQTTKNSEYLALLEFETKVMTKIIEDFRNEILGKHFQIRNIKADTWMNGRICKVEHITKHQSTFDPHLCCTIKGEEDQDKKYSLKLSTMVDYCVDAEDLIGDVCMKGTIFKETRTLLCSNFIRTMLREAILWLTGLGEEKWHHSYRLLKLNRVLENDQYSVAQLSCMDFPEESDLTGVCPKSAALAAVRPGCIGDGLVDFTRFGQLMCGCDEKEQLVNRFREYLVSGMCHLCQVYYIERKIQEQEGEYLIGKMFAKLSRLYPNIFYGPKSRTCLSLGISKDIYISVCDAVDACFQKNSPKSSVTIKTLKAFVKNIAEQYSEMPNLNCEIPNVTHAQFDACIEMMSEVGLVKQVGNSVLQLRVVLDDERNELNRYSVGRVT